MTSEAISKMMEGEVPYPQRYPSQKWMRCSYRPGSARWNALALVNAAAFADRCCWHQSTSHGLTLAMGVASAFGLSVAEIAEAAERSESTVRRRLRDGEARARGRIA